MKLVVFEKKNGTLCRALIVEKQSRRVVVSFDPGVLMFVTGMTWQEIVELPIGDYDINI